MVVSTSTPEPRDGLAVDVATDGVIDPPPTVEEIDAIDAKARALLARIDKESEG